LVAIAEKVGRKHLLKVKRKKKALGSRQRGKREDGRWGERRKFKGQNANS
jgi:hypothetical protein